MNPIESAHEKGDTVNAVLLLSKKLATWLGNDATFLQRFVSVLAPQQVRQVTLLAAVVDRLPSPSSGWSRSPGEELQLLHKDRGFEGIAYYASVGQTLFGDLSANVAAKALEPSPTRPDVAASGESPPCISFDLYDHVASDARAPSRHTTITVPLANTVFETGRPATATLTQWTLSGGQWDTAKPAQDVAYENATVALHAHGFDRVDQGLPTSEARESLANSHSARLWLPLEPLVPARRIENAMGNIVTKVSDDGTQESLRPASQELEAAVSDYFARRGADPSVVAVWALIVPARLAASHASLVAEAQQAWRVAEDTAEDARTCSRYVSALVWAGATLRKVLSGGGGWGQKAGLLSVDPEDDYVSRKASIPSFLASLSGAEEGAAAMYPDLTSRGDMMAFFAAPESPQMFEQGDVTTAGREAATLDFGVLPSTMDGDFTEGESLEVKDEDYEVHADHFGALSEGGMGVSIEAVGARSKVDVPYGRFSHQVYV